MNGTGNIWTDQLNAVQYQLPLSASYSPQLTVLIVIYTIALVIALFGIGARIKRKHFWFFRLGEGGQIVPNTASHVVLWTTIFILLTTTAMVEFRSIYIFHADPSNALIWHQMVWIPMVISSYFQAWGILSSSFGGKSKYTRYWNVLLCFIPIATLIVISIPLTLATLRYNQLMLDRLDVIALLQKGSDNYNGTVDLALVQSLLKTQTRILTLFDEMLHYTKVGFGCYAFTSTSFNIAFFVGGILVYRKITAQIKLHTSAAIALRASSTPTRSTFVEVFINDPYHSYGTRKGSIETRKGSIEKDFIQGTSNLKEAEASEAKVVHLRMTLRSLIFQMSFNLLCFIAYSVFLFFTTLNAAGALRAENLEALTFVPLYIYGLSGIPSLILVTIHSFKSGSFIGSKLRPSIPVAFIQEEDDFNTEELNDQLGLQQSSTYKSSHGNSNKSISGSDSEWSRSRSGSEMDTISTNGIGKKTSQSPLLDVPRDVGGKRTRERFQKPGSVE